MKRPVKLSLFIGLFLAATSVAALILYAQTLPTFESIMKDHRVSDRLILDRNGLVLDEIRIDKKTRRLDWVTLNQVSPVFLDVLLRAEDARFRLHPGIDPIAFISAGWGVLTRTTHRGASTISMQVAGFIDKSKSGKHRSFSQKISQAITALALEMRWSKDQILEAYVNKVYFRGELQGLSAASHGLLDKAPYALTLPDSAVLVSLIRAPNANLKMIKQRACWLIESVQHNTCVDLDQSYWAGLEQGYQIRSQLALAPHVARFLMAQKEFSDSARVTSTIDRDLQSYALQILQKHVLGLKNQNLNDGAVVVIENSTGNVLAYVGNMGPLSTAPYVDAAKAQRQAGSTLKPFMYALGFDKKIMTPATLLKDEPMGISVATGVYRPNNFDRGFHKVVSIRSALGSSLNIPAVEALEIIGVDNVHAKLEELGLTGLQRADFYGPSLALGSADVRLIELANAYRALANKGVWSPIKFYPNQKGEEPRRVFSEQAAYVVGNVISDPESRADTFGLESILSTRFWTAVKTGTSKDMRDNWCVGFSEKYTVGVWGGNFSGESMWNVAGVQGAAPVWVEVMSYLHKHTPSSAPPMPAGVVTKQVYFPHSQQTKQEVFIAGTEPSSSTINFEEEVRSQIVYPLNQALIAIDPDIPSSRHRMFFEVKGPTENLTFYLDGKKLAAAAKLYPWEPKPGSHRLELRSEKTTLDAVSFEVRGRKLRASNP